MQSLPKKQRMLFYAAATGLVLLVGAFVCTRLYQQYSFKPRTEELGVVKFNPQTGRLIYSPKKGSASKDFPDIKRQFSKDLLMGVGCKLTFMREPNLPDSSAVSKDFVVQAFKSYRQKSKDARRIELEKKWEEFEQLKEWLMNKDRNALVELVLDNTDGLPEDLLDQFNTIVLATGIPEIVKASDQSKVLVYSWPIGETEFGTDSAQEFTSSNIGSYVSLLTETLKPSLFREEYKKQASESAIADSILRFTKEHPNHPDRVIYIDSDGMEYSTKLNLYAQRKWLEPEKSKEGKVTYPGYEEIDKLLWGEGEERQLPPVANAIIHWYAPPSFSSDPMLVRKALAYWKHALELAGAKVVIH